MTLSNITDLLPCPDKKGHIDVYADGYLLMTVSEDAVLEAGLRVGEALDTARLEQIEYSVTLTKAKAKAYNYLSYGDMSKSALCKKLVRYGFAQEISEDVCNALEQAGYIDDERYAMQLTSYLANTKLYGPRRIVQELCVKDISKSLAEQSLENAELDFEKNLKTLADGKFRPDSNDRKSVQKMFASLVRYGYDYEMIGGVLSATEEEYE